VASLTITQALVELVILEPLLGWPGIGQLSIQAAQSKDLPVLSALVLLSGLLAITANMLSDVVQARLHPQLRARAA
jgi:peptide/nickel transport system permease protein